MGEPLNLPGGSLRLEGVPARWRPGASYRIAVVVRRDSMVRAGFEIAARFLEGGAQAGRLAPFDTALAAVTVDTSNAVAYVHHTRTGTGVADGEGRWIVVWTAPRNARGTVDFHAVSVAANDDNSNFGDIVYTAVAASRRR